MNKIIRLTSYVVMATFLNGCAHLPDATVGYYLAKSEVKFKVIRTVTCDANNNLIVVSSGTPSVTHAADHDQFVPIKLNDLKGPFSDADIKFDFYEDGRLKGINSSSTGQGEIILKTTVSVAAAALALKGITTRNYPKECAFIKSAGGGKPLTLTYEGIIDVTKSADEKQIIPPDPMSIFYAEQLRDAIGDVYAVVEEATKQKEVPLNYVAKSEDVLLKARQPGLVKIKVMPVGANGQAGTIWEGELPVAQFGTFYSIPVSAPALFGKQVFAISFQESGGLTSLQYVSNNGASQVLNVVNSSLNALQGESTAQKATNIKAEADLIAQQQRLARCLADPTKCE
jgi:hypothetical protein